MKNVVGMMGLMFLMSCGDGETDSLNVQDRASDSF